ncbi:MAG: choice-of-anchor B family protein [Bacteroidota bacterium]
MKQYCLSLCFCLSFLAGFGQPQKNISLIGQLPYDDDLNDIWGYVDAAGTEYALVGLRNALSIVSLADPSQPAELFRIPGPRSVWRDMKTFDHYAYVSNETDSGILIIDLTNLPNAIDHKFEQLDGVKTAHNLYIDGSKLYAVGTNNFNGGMAIWELGDDPWNPAFLGAYTERYVHDVYARNDTAFTAEINDGLLTIVDMTNPASTRVIGSRSYPNAFTHNTWLSVSGNHVFTTDEFSGAFVQAWDVSDPEDINLSDQIRASISQGEAAPHNTHVLDDFLITSYYKDGIQIVDARDPEGLVEVGYFDTSPLEGAGLDGCWGAYPFLPSGLILASDIQEGLFVLAPTYVRAGRLKGVVVDESNAAPLSGVQIDIEGQAFAESSNTSGRFNIGTERSGFQRVFFSKFGYFDQEITIDFQNGGSLDQEVRLLRKARTSVVLTIKEGDFGEGIQGAEVVLNAENDAASFQFFTDENGQIQLPDFVSGKYEVICGKWGFISKKLDVEIQGASQEVFIGIERGYYDDFSLDFGWKSSGTAARGKWIRAEPLGTFETLFQLGAFNPEEDLADDIGDQAWITGNANTNPVSDDVDNGFVQLLSPEIDLSIYQDPQLSFSYWLVNWSFRQGGQTGNDFLAVRLIQDQDTFELARLIGPFDNEWTELSFRLREIIPDLGEPVRLLFYTQDFETDNQDVVEAGIDGFRIKENLETPLNFSYRVFPNPLPDRFYLTYSRIPSTEGLRDNYFVILDLSGREVFRTFLLPGTASRTIDLPLQKGLYIGRFFRSEGREALPLTDVKLLR